MSERQDTVLKAWMRKGPKKTGKAMKARKDHAHPMDFQFVDQVQPCGRISHE